MENVDKSNVQEITKLALSAFNGSESFYRHSLARNVIFTEGCAFLAMHGACWLIDEIALAQRYDALLTESFQSWELSVDPSTSTALLVATDGGAEEDYEGNVIYKELFRKHIPFTDFPLNSITLYCCSNGEDRNGKTIMLISEY